MLNDECNVQGYKERRVLYRKMYGAENRQDGIPPALYRTPAQIKRDIAHIVKEIKEADEMLSVRNILTEMIDELATEEPARWIEELEVTVAEAREAMDRLERLHNALAELSVELEEAKWIRKYF